MSIRLLAIIILCSGTQTVVLFSSARADEYTASVRPLLQKHCFQCHGEGLQEGNLRIDQLNADLINGNDADRWHEVLNRINVGEMPPKDETPLSPEELDTLTEWLSGELHKAARARRSTGGQNVLRRLNRREYGNTLRDLFGVPLNFEKPLPPDAISEDGFLNNGATLAMSPLHFDYYLKISRLAVEKALPAGDKPAVAAYGFNLSLGNPATVDARGRKKPATMKLDAEFLDIATNSARRGKPPVTVGFGRRADRGDADERGALLAPGLRARGTGIPGRQVPNPSIVFRFREFPTEGPVRVRVIAGSADPDEELRPQVRVFIGTLLDDGTEFAFLGSGQLVTHDADEPGVYEFHGQLEDLPLPFRQRVAANRGDLNVMMLGVMNSVDAEVDQKQTPRLMVSRVEFEAPFYAEWPPSAAQEVFFNGAASAGKEVEYAREIFARFMTRAWRRPVRPAELDRVHTAWQHVWQEDVVAQREPESKAAEPEPGRPGIRVSYFAETPPDAAVETLNSMTPAAEGVVDQISLDVPQRKLTEKYALRFSGVLNVPADGFWTLRLSSDDGSRLYLDNDLLIDNDGNHGMQERTGEIKLSAGPHLLVVNYFNSRGGSGLKLEWEGPGIRRSPIAARFLSHGGSIPSPQPPTPSFESTVKLFLPAILASPNFLYLAEPVTQEQQLSNYELASRLSYFLWNTMPDSELQQLAESGQLSRPGILRQQVKRMLHDERSSEFTRNFVDQWLDLDGVQRVAINKDRYKDFWDETKVAMQQETRLFFAELLRHDLSALNLIESDFTMLNDHLAEHYRVRGVTGPEFRRVALQPDDHRGGLLTHGSLLYGGSDGRDSHPIRRGVWLLRKLLDDPPPDPPPNVPDLDQTDPKISGLPLKKQLEVHRGNPACANCHRKIDPWGIAFENYSAVGRWRGEKGLREFVPNAASSTLPDGTEIDSLVALKAYLIEHRQQDFAKALTKYLLSYALGRTLDFSDEELVESMSSQFGQHDFQLRWLIEEIVVSAAFRSR